MPAGPAIRVIPRIDIKGGNLVKGIHLEGLRVLGTPGLFASRYAREGADELIFMDAVASLYGRNSLLDVIKHTAKDVFIPIAVGGGIRTLDDIASALKAGADKVAINTGAVNNPDFIRLAAERFGSSTIVVHVDAKAEKSGIWRVWTENGREPSHMLVVDWVEKAQSLGCGEIFVTSIDQEGTTAGYDTALCKAVADAVSVPVVACGGAGSARHVVDVVQEADISAVSMASILHYGIAAELDRDGFEFSGAGGFKVLVEKRGFDRVKPTSISSIKREMRESGLECRPDSGAGEARW